MKKVVANKDRFLTDSIKVQSFKEGIIKTIKSIKENL